MLDLTADPPRLDEIKNPNALLLDGVSASEGTGTLKIPSLHPTSSSVSNDALNSPFCVSPGRWAESDRMELKHSMQLYCEQRAAIVRELNSPAALSGDSDVCLNTALKRVSEFSNSTPLQFKSFKSFPESLLRELEPSEMSKSLPGSPWP